jgi:hypothetical protein
MLTNDHQSCSNKCMKNDFKQNTVSKFEAKCL